MCMCIRKEAFQLHADDCQHSDGLAGLCEVTKGQLVVVVSIWSAITGNSCYTILHLLPFEGAKQFFPSAGIILAPLLLLTSQVNSI